MKADFAKGDVYLLICGGRLLWTTQALFPRDLFARFDFFASRRRVNALPGMNRIVSFGDQPSPIPDSVLADLRVR